MATRKKKTVEDPANDIHASTDAKAFTQKKVVLEKAPVVENPVELKQYDIDWTKIATNVQEAAELAKTLPKEEPKKTTRKKK